MAKYKQIKLRWNPAPEQDIVGYRIYCETGVTITNYLAPYSHFVPSTKALDADSKFFIDVPTDLPGMPLVDDDYAFGICAVDDFGHEGDLLTMASPLDFVAPGILTGGEILIT